MEGRKAVRTTYRARAGSRLRRSGDVGDCCRSFCLPQLKPLFALFFIFFHGLSEQFSTARATPCLPRSLPC